METIFKETLKELEERYKENFKEKGDSWKEMSIEDLAIKFDEELEEYSQSDTKEDFYDELIDCLLVGLMLAERIKQEGDQ